MAADAAAEVTPWPTRFPTRGVDDSSHVGASTDVGRIVCKTGDEIFTRLSITICAIVLTILHVARDFGHVASYHNTYRFEYTHNIP